MSPWQEVTLTLLAAVAALYGVHRLFLRLERLGYMYYLREKPKGGVANSLMTFQQFVEPAVQHAIETQKGGHQDPQGATSPSMLLARLVASLLETMPVDPERIRRILAIARRAGHEWRDLYAEAVEIARQSNHERAALAPPPERVDPDDA